MGDFVLTVSVLLLFAWVARGLLGARELTWRRTVLAVFTGMVFGMTVATLLVLRSLEDPPEV